MCNVAIYILTKLQISTILVVLLSRDSIVDRSDDNVAENGLIFIEGWGGGWGRIERSSNYFQRVKSRVRSIQIQLDRFARLRQCIKGIKVARDSNERFDENALSGTPEHDTSSGLLADSYYSRVMYSGRVKVTEWTDWMNWARYIYVTFATSDRSKDDWIIKYRLWTEKPWRYRLHFAHVHTYVHA